ncbi:MAG: hypothetical protein LBL91_03665 [Lachnospiraceae bacterium]|jgi:DNA/RNA-binding domain of Phe-tRNA-synthetase-like protein|nr:hypothetical protein [Lachnospiraceae bacterium]
MKISIQEEILEKYPNYKMGLVKVKVASKNCEKVQAFTKYEKSIADEAEVEKEWLKVFKDMNASDRRLPSIVALWNIIDRFGELKPINYFVDIYNYISVKYGIPMGGYDMAKLPNEELTLKYAVVGGTKFEPMGLAGQLEKIKDPAEVCYYCGDVPVCRYWNNKDSEITKIDENSSDVLIMFDTLGTNENLQEAISELVKIIKETSDVIELKTEILNTEKANCEM